MWSIAHAQGIKLPTRDYWEFRDTITVSEKRARSFDGYLQLFHWTELIQSSPIAVERAGLRGRRRRVPQEQHHDDRSSASTR
jgi:adenosine deaminase